MSYYEFEACRVSGDGNAIFPAQIIIDEDEEVLIYRKPKLIGSKETRVRFGAIGSVTIEKHVLFADIIISNISLLGLRIYQWSSLSVSKVFNKSLFKFFWSLEFSRSSSWMFLIRNKQLTHNPFNLFSLLPFLALSFQFGTTYHLIRDIVSFAPFQSQCT